MSSAGLLGPPRAPGPPRRSSALDAWCFHAHLVAAVLTEHLEQRGARPAPWPHPAHALRAEAFSQRPQRGQLSGCRGGDEAEAARSMSPTCPQACWPPGPEPRPPGHCDLTSVEAGPWGAPPAQPRAHTGLSRRVASAGPPAGQAGVSPGALTAATPGRRSSALPGGRCVLPALRTGPAPCDLQMLGPAQPCPPSPSEVAWGPRCRPPSPSCSPCPSVRFHLQGPQAWPCAHL